MTGETGPNIFLTVAIEEADISAGIERFVTEAVTQRLGAEAGNALTADTPLIELGVMDSLLIFELVAFIEDRFGAVVPHESLVPENFASVAALAEMVRGLGPTDPRASA